MRPPTSLVNPYVGPRAFRVGEQLPNRERETTELTNLLLAERIVLLHAPSGAGKTSLIQTAVNDRLRQRGFEPTKALRVDYTLPRDVAPRNRYVFSVALDLLGENGSRAAELVDLSLAESLSELPSTSGRRVIVLDQLEEILTSSPEQAAAKKDFFEQLGDALDDRSLWALLAIREDYMGALDRYLRYLPGHLRARYRLDFLSERDALAAIQKPAETQGVTFADDAAKALVNKLSGAGHIEPFQLQVVCRSMWKTWRRKPANRHATTIRLADVAGVDIDRALSVYYARSMDDLDEEFAVEGVRQRMVRDWLEEELITVNRLRTQTTGTPVPGELGRRVRSKLEAMYLIRSDTRANTTWYELSHDRLVGAILEDNQGWQLRCLESWQVAAYEWKRKNRHSGFLLPASKLPYAPDPETANDLLAHEREYLRQSVTEAGQQRHAKVTASRLVLITRIATVELAVIVVLLAVVVVLATGN